MPELAKALRGRNVTGFRKRDFFALCRFWGYKSNIWVSVERDAVEALCPSPPPRRTPRAAPLPRVTDPAAEMLRREVAAALAAFQHFNRLPSLAAATAADPRAPLATMDVQARIALRPRCIGLPAHSTRLTRRAPGGVRFAEHARRAHLVG